MIRALAGMALLGLAARLTRASTDTEVAGEFVDRLSILSPRGRWLTQSEIDHVRQASRHPKFNINTAFDIFFEECLDSHVSSSPLPVTDQEEMDTISSECESQWHGMLDHFDGSIRYRAKKP